MPRILHFDSELTWRGGQRQLTLLLQGLKGTEFEGYLAAPLGSKLCGQLEVMVPCFCFAMHGISLIPAARKLAELCSEHSIDIVDCHASKAHSIAVLAASFFNLPSRVIVHRRVDYPPKQGWFNRRKYHHTCIKRYVAISNAIKDVLVSYGIESDRIAVAKSAVPGKIIDDEQRQIARSVICQRHQIDATTPIIVCAAALTTQKGHQYLVEALAEVKRHGQPFHCLIIGSGELHVPLLRQSRVLGLDTEVEFCGFQEDVSTYLGAADVMCMASVAEGLGTVILDAIYAGACVVASRVGGIPEIIEDDSMGLLSQPRNAKALADNILHALRSDSYRRSSNQKARVHALESFSVGQMVRANLDVYAKVLAE